MRVQFAVESLSSLRGIRSLRKGACLCYFHQVQLGLLIGLVPVPNKHRENARSVAGYLKRLRSFRGYPESMIEMARFRHFQ
jgi:hypothetical protein